MMGCAKQRGEKLFYVGVSLEERVPADHPLRGVDAAVDFSFVRGEVAHLYGDNGHVSLDPALVLRMMLLVYLDAVRSEREFVRCLPLRLDWLWFCRLDLDSSIPDHSVLSKARQRWGEELFNKVFTRVLDECDRAGLVGKKTAHADSTLLRAHADKDGRVSRMLWEQMETGLVRSSEHANKPENKAENRPERGDTACERAAHSERVDHDDHDDHDDDHDDPPGLTITSTRAASPARSQRATRNTLLVSPTDPDAATHTRQGIGTTLGYRDHRLTDDLRGIILATHITPADGDDGAQLPVLLHQMAERVERLPREVTGDSQYGTKSNYEYCEQRGIKPYLKKRRGKDTPRVSWLALLRPGCTPWHALRLMGRRRTVAEGSFAQAHTSMNHRRCRWRRRWRVQIQAYLVATVQNIKKLVKSRRKSAGGVATLAPAPRASPLALLARLTDQIQTRITNPRMRPV